MLKDAGVLKTSEAYRFDIMDLQRQIMTNLGQGHSQGGGQGL